MNEKQFHARLDIELLLGQAKGWEAASAKVLAKAKAAFGCEGCQDEADLLREIAAQFKQESDKLAAETAKKRAEYNEQWKQS